MDSSLTSDLLLSIILLLMGVVILIDLKWNRIPNLICIGFFIVGLSIQIHVHTYSGILLAISGCFTGLLLFLPFYIYKGMAAGDVKLLASLGALLGPFDTMLAAAYTLVIGAVLAFLILFTKAFLIAGWRSITELIKSYMMSLSFLLVHRTLVVPEPVNAELKGIRFPYALAITSGSTLVLLQGSFLNFFHLKALLISQLSLTGGVL